MTVYQKAERATRVNKALDFMAKVASPVAAAAIIGMFLLWTDVVIMNEQIKSLKEIIASKPPPELLANVRELLDGQGKLRVEVGSLKTKMEMWDSYFMDK